MEKGDLNFFILKYLKKIAKQNEKLKDFIEMCFEPGTLANKRLKASLFKILTEEDKSE